MEGSRREAVAARRARAPGSSANLGPGFDAVALAVSLHVEVEVCPARRLKVQSEGEGRELPRGPDHLAARIVTGVLGHDRVAIRVRSTVPLRRGLGSSAALAVAAAAAAGASDPLAVAAALDGHPENAAASVLGGLVAATVADEGPVARRLPLDPGLALVALVPDLELPTTAARAVLPSAVALADAAANLGRLALLLAGLADRHLLLPVAGEDRLHQAPRTALFPQAPALLAALRDAGATVACWSGAGPSLLGLCEEPEIAARVRAAGERALAEAGVAGRAVVLTPDLEGLVVEDLEVEGPGDPAGQPG